VCIGLSGHSKFSNIKHKKERNDAAKGKVFTRLGREIAVAVKSGGPDPEANGKLRDIIAKAKASNMPTDTIDRSVKKAAGDLNSVDYENIIYEGYGPEGCAVMVEALTDNRNRTAANVRSAFSKVGGNLGANGCVSFMFDQKGQIVLEKEDEDDNIDEDELMMLALDAGAEDFTAEAPTYEILTDPESFSAVQAGVEASLKDAKLPLNIVSAEVTYLPQTYTHLDNAEDQKKMRRLLDMLDDIDDVMNVYHSWEEEAD
jgi:YebC/PmpR family DNA-binding regulatory protein